MNTPQATALAVAQSVANLATQAIQLYKEIKALQACAGALNPDAIWQQLQTAPLNADGSVSASPDASPNTAHPIVVASLNVSRNSLIGAYSYLGDVANCLDGTSSPSTTNRIDVLNQIAGVAC